MALQLICPNCGAKDWDVSERTTVSAVGRVWDGGRLRGRQGNREVKIDSQAFDITCRICGHDLPANSPTRNGIVQDWISW